MNIENEKTEYYSRYNTLKIENLKLRLQFIIVKEICKQLEELYNEYNGTNKDALEKAINYVCSIHNNVLKMFE